MKKIIFIACLMLVGQAQAGFINRVDFSPSAIDVDFSDVVDNSATYTSGNLTVSGGTGKIGVDPFVVPFDEFNYTNNGESGNPAGAPIRLDFSSLISAIGVDIFYNVNPVLFELYDSNDSLLDSLLASPTDYHEIGGYMGLEMGASVISYAVLSMPALPNEFNLVIDNIVYQSVARVPEPASLALLGLGLAGLGFARKKKTS